MKLLILLFLCACTKVSYREVPGARAESNPLSTVSIPSGFEAEIDLMVAFLWPEKILPQDRPLLKEIISLSRTLKSEKEKFQRERFQLRLSFAQASCECVLDQTCRGDESRCLELEEELYQLDAQLPIIYEMVETIKAKTILIGGDWLETHVERTDLPRSSMDFKNLSVSFSILGSHALVAIPTVNGSGSYQTLLYANEGWRFEVAPSVSDASLTFQGELYHSERQGVIFWEHARTAPK